MVFRLAGATEYADQAEYVTDEYAMHSFSHSNIEVGGYVHQYHHASLQQLGNAYSFQFCFCCYL